MNKHIQFVLNNTNHPKWLDTSIHYATIMGSQAYSCHNEVGVKTPRGSDMDIYGFCVPPKEMIFPHLSGNIRGFGKEPPNFEQFQQHHIENKGDRKEYDVAIFGIVKYFQLLMENNPNMIDSIFTPESCVLHMTDMGKMVKDGRHLFLSKIVKTKMGAYAYSQLRKLSANVHASGESRKESIATYGYDLKKSYHTIRLVLQAEQILTEHDLDLGRNAEILKDIRAGNWTLEEVQDYFSQKEKILDELYHTSTLQLRPNEDAIKQLLINCLEHHYGSLSKAELIVPNKEQLLIADLRTLLNKYD